MPRVRASSLPSRCLADGGADGPTPRSGHRMVNYKNKLVVFGGYFDNGRGNAKFNNGCALGLSRGVF